VNIKEADVAGPTARSNSSRVIFFFSYASHNIIEPIGNPNKSPMITAENALELILKILFAIQSLRLHLPFDAYALT
jgi:hypothetical protein